MPVNIKLGLGINSGGGARFTPKKISGLALWLDASDLSTITKDGSNYVSEWRDKAGSAAKMVQATGSKQPLFDGVKVVFDGNSDVLVSASNIDFSSTKAISVFMVLKNLTTSYVAGGAFSALLELTPSWFTVTNGFSLNFSKGTTYDGIATALKGDVGFNNYGTTDANYITTKGMLLAIFDKNKTGGPESEVYVNNVAKTLALNGTLGTDDKDNGNTFANSTIHIGARSSGAASTFANIELNELIVYKSNLSVPDRQKVTNYLLRKWGVTI